MLNLKPLPRGRNSSGIHGLLPPPLQRSLIAIGLGLLLNACGVQYEMAPPPAPASPLIPVETLAPTPPPTSPKASDALDAVKKAVLADLSQRLGRPVAHFQVEQAEPHTWPDGCLGLATPEQFCTQALVPGWRVTVTEKTQFSSGNAAPTWVYRTDAQGSHLKPEP